MMIEPNQGKALSPTLFNIDLEEIIRTMYY